MSKQNKKFEIKEHEDYNLFYNPMPDIDSKEYNIVNSSGDGHILAQHVTNVKQYRLSIIDGVYIRSIVCVFTDKDAISYLYYNDNKGCCMIANNNNKKQYVWLRFRNDKDNDNDNYTIGLFISNNDMCGYYNDAKVFRFYESGYNHILPFYKTEHTKRVCNHMVTNTNNPDPDYECDNNIEYLIYDINCQYGRFSFNKKLENIPTCVSYMYEQLKDEIESLYKPESADKSVLCVICNIRKKSIMFDECKHVCICNKCIPKADGECPVCHTKGITIKVFL